MYLALQTVGEQLAHAAEAAAQTGNIGLFNGIFTVPGIIEVNDTTHTHDQRLQRSGDLLSRFRDFHITGILIFPASGIFFPDFVSLMEYSVQTCFLLETFYRTHGIVHGIGSGSDHSINSILHTVSHRSL